ncbi:hypothetical protein [Methanobrevibacter sp.]
MATILAGPVGLVLTIIGVVICRLLQEILHLGVQELQFLIKLTLITKK